MRRISQIVVLFIALTVSVIAAATAQAPDRVIVDGKELPLNTNPLDPYLRQKEVGSS
jgi:hypothetical protein